MAASATRPAVARWRRVLRALSSLGARVPPLAGLLGGLLAAGSTDAAEVPEDRADVMVHLYDGGGVRASGPALLVRKSLARKVSVYATYYADIVSNASIDVVTTASPYSERRKEEGLGIDTVVRDTLVRLALTRSREPDFTADSGSLDIAEEVFGGMTTISLGYTRSFDTIGKKGTAGQFAGASHSRYRLGATQVLTPRLLVGASLEALTDEGYLGSPYRVARELGAAVPERVPRTRSARAVKLHVIGDLGSRTVLRGEYRYYYDTWEIRARTAEIGLRERLGSALQTEVYVRGYSQDSAVFYSDNAPAQTTFVSRNRQFGTFQSAGVGARLAYAAGRLAGRYDIKLNGAYERVRYSYDDFTDIRTGKLYSHDADVFQLSVSATF